MVITDERLAEPLGLEHVLSQALEAGAPAIQLRAKDATAREVTAMARRLLPMVRSAGALFFVNDRLDVALVTGADGVHLGPDDPPVKEVRSAVPRDFIVGYSTDNPEEAARAEADGADYLGSGTVYPTTNKSDPGEVIGLSGLQRVVEAVSIPVVGIGGITPERGGRRGRSRGPRDRGHRGGHGRPGSGGGRSGAPQALRVGRLVTVFLSLRSLHPSSFQQARHLLLGDEEVPQSIATLGSVPVGATRHQQVRSLGGSLELEDVIGP